MQSGRCKARKSRTMTRVRAGARQSHVAKGAQAADPMLRKGFDLTVPHLAVLMNRTRRTRCAAMRGAGCADAMTCAQMTAMKGRACGYQEKICYEYRG